MIGNGVVLDPWALKAEVEKLTAQGVSAFPAEVTHQMVANFSAGGAAINQLARTVGAELSVVPLEVERQYKTSPMSLFTVLRATRKAIDN